ncbi:MAG: beta-lactamase family protein [Blastomonas sp.]|jgi:CubicO group peptidase (beta-lactamase class C family)|uniref:serine hydrolase domain-containing protein n=1 Tax=Sphingomonadales TaxID=204457 RepID=UPI00093F708D|nr:serine hydrolase domain-containing protein [Erythrobacter donghaensis]MCH2239824.1 beta-lactamase family protein [Blastomonas sp.]
MNEELMMGLKMKRRVLLLTVLCAAAPGQAEPSIPGTAPPLEAAFNRASAVLSRARLPGELVVADANGAERAVAYGLADREARKANRVGQRWVWASITKQVTASLVMQEVDRGRISLDAAIGTFLPGFGGDRAITIRQLLQHRSGLPNPADTPAVDGVPTFYRETGSGIGNAARAAGFCAGAAKRPRGGDWEYNNCDYLVLGAVLEAVTGLPYGRLVDERIARPLGLRSLRLAPDGATRGGAAAVGYDGAARVAAVNVATGGASHALTGSARDLAKLDRALMAGRLLSPQARATAWAGDAQLGFMALGVWSFPARLEGCAAPVQIVERRGDFAGTQVRNIIAPGLDRAVILFTNDQSVEFGEVWQGKGLTFDLLSAALCPANP